MKYLLFFCFAVAVATGAERITKLTLEQALELAEQNHPDLVEARALTEAAKARRAQAGKLPNPEAVARIESAPFNGRTADSAEYVAGVSQAVPVSGRLSASREVARKELDAAQARVELRRRELHSRVHGAFATTLYFDAVLTTFSNNLTGAQSLTAMTKARAQAGDALREDVARAEMDEFQARVEMKSADAARQLALADLLAAIGRNAAAVNSVSGSLTNALALPAIEKVAADLAKTPAVAVAEADAAAQRARLQLAKAERIPDINFDLFYRRLQETRQDAFDVGVRVPIPLFTRSRVREANAEAQAAEARASSARLNAQQQFNRALADLNRALDSARVISAEILPRALLVLTNAEARYKLGDASLADVLQKRRDWNATQTSYLQSLREVHDAWRALTLFIDKDRRSE
jgi:cobalt-zinc-cadmium efflux system outer membrane protein